MARPVKDGVDYFPKDTDFYNDDKIRLLRAEFGAKGMYILDYILCDLYGKNGYFIKWDENKCFLVSDGAGCGCNPENITQIVQGCVRRSIFDKRVFDVFGVLTSAGIQRRYIRMFNSRDEIQIISEYWLLDINEKKDVPASVRDKVTLKSIKSTENPDKSTENPDKSTVNSQSKVKESKVNKSKVNYFELFWCAYPKKVGKAAAIKAFEKLNPDSDLLTKMLSAISEQKKTQQWQRDNGQYIPFPATWVNGRRWEDDITISSAQPERPHTSYDIEKIKDNYNDFDNLGF